MIASLDRDPVAVEPPGLFAMLGARARRSSDALLASLAGIGVVAAVALAAIRPAWWAFALPLVSAGTFGLWGMLERDIAERGVDRSARYDRIVGALQRTAMVIGTLCAIITVFAVVGILLGPFNN
jgi:hypothetical protein